MNMLPEKAKYYLLQGLESAPVVIDRILQTTDSIDWDHRRDPERFTLREVICHLADWEPIWLERIRRMAEEDTPTLPGYDEGRLAIDRDYAHANPQEQLARFREGRKNLLTYLRNLPAESWLRRANHAEWHNLSIEHLATLILGHDGYHTRQVAEWVSAK